MATIKEAQKSLSDKSIRHIVNLSGGKDSTTLAVYMRESYPEIPAEYIFCDTGCELPETYEYLERLEAMLGAKIHRLNALNLLDVEKKPNRIPFDFWLYEVYGGFLPNARSRWCTRTLKIEPFEAYVGEGQAFSYIGIRADEDRDGYVVKKPPVISQRPNILPVYPFKNDGIGLADVKGILEKSGLGLPKYYKWRSRSGCYFCFFQQKIEWLGLLENHPELFRLAGEYEKADETTGKRFTWCNNESLQELARPERLKSIKEEHKRRMERISTRSGRLIEVLEDDVGPQPCLICTL